MILIIGATGMSGSRVLKETAARDAPVRALAHSADTADRLRASGVEVAVADLDRPETLDSAFTGVETVFLVAPMDDRIAVRETNALRTAQEAGVQGRQALRRGPSPRRFARRSAPREHRRAPGVRIGLGPRIPELSDGDKPAEPGRSR